ncbi:MAG: hypothetical protein IJH55_04350 [Romboutsia sp.]|nr:hypothetical protein [Romboutsia sp.]
MPKINSPRMFSAKNTIDKMTMETGLEGKTVKEDEDILEYNIQLPDIITDLQNKTNLTRKTVIDILVNSKRLEDFKRNPQKYIEEVTKIIRKNLRLMVVDGISYSKFKDGDCYSIKMFNDNELLAYLNDKIVESKKSPYNYAICDSYVETKFAKKFEERDEIKVYVKLPSWFKIDTPIGSYNPDWAEERLYFVVETKGKSDINLLRKEEQSKIKCAKKHFEALGKDVVFMSPENNPDEFIKKTKSTLYN